MKQIIILIFGISIFFASCTKDKDKEYTVSGRIYEDCTNKSFANRQIKLRQLIAQNWSLQTSGGEVGRTTTDVNGNFSITYKPKNSSELRIQVPAGFGYSTVIERLPGEKDINNLNINYNATTAIQVKINVINPHTSNDTLFISDYRNLTIGLKIPGPFTSSILYTALNYEVLNSYVPVNYQFPLRYKINNNSWSIKDFQLVQCDTTRVSADIN
jgi:hypothetical protein